MWKENLKDKNKGIFGEKANPNMLLFNRIGLLFTKKIEHFEILAPLKLSIA
jgi:hypothetical protein